MQVNTTRLQPNNGESDDLESHPYGMCVLAKASVTSCPAASNQAQPRAARAQPRAEGRNHIEYRLPGHKCLLNADTLSVAADGNPPSQTKVVFIIPAVVHGCLTTTHHIGARFINSLIKKINFFWHSLCFLQTDVY